MHNNYDVYLKKNNNSMRFCVSVVFVILAGPASQHGDSDNDTH